MNGRMTPLPTWTAGVWQALPQWSRPMNGRMTRPSRDGEPQVLAAAMEPADERPDDRPGPQWAIVDAFDAAMEPADERPDDLLAKPPSAMETVPQWSRPMNGRMTRPHRRPGSRTGTPRRNGAGR